MTTITIKNVSNYTNAGMACEQSLAYYLTGEMRKHDHVAFDMGSDIPEFYMSVKSAKATLASGNKMVAQDFDGMINEYMARTASKVVAYVTKSFQVYIMDMVEFEQFLRKFSSVSRDSSKNGGRRKIQFRSESKAMLRWFEAMCVA